MQWIVIELILFFFGQGMASYKVQATLDLLLLRLRKWSAQIGQGEGVGVGGYTEYIDGPWEGEGGRGYRVHRYNTYYEKLIEYMGKTFMTHYAMNGYI